MKTGTKKRKLFSDPCLEAEDSDKETDCSCDAQTQHHRLGVVETVKKKQQQQANKHK